jgi:hypothetical protein
MEYDDDPGADEAAGRERGRLSAEEMFGLLHLLIEPHKTKPGTKAPGHVAPMKVHASPLPDFAAKARVGLI